MGTTTLPPKAYSSPFYPSSVTKHADLHEKPAGLPVPPACFIICQFGFFTICTGREQRSKKMPAFVISDKRKDLVSLLVSTLLGVASDLVERVCGGVVPCNKAIPPLLRPTVSKYSPYIKLSVWVISILFGWADNMSSFCCLARRTRLPHTYGTEFTPHNNLTHNTGRDGGLRGMTIVEHPDVNSLS